MTPNITLYAALILYALGTLTVFGSLVDRNERLQRIALVMMIIAFISHTFWIGTICVRTGHPPMTNLPETTAFLSWLIFAGELLVFLRWRVHAASFFVYPLVLMLLTITAVVHEPFARMDPSLRSGFFLGHILLTVIGVAGLLIGLAFTMLASFQHSMLKTKRRGMLYDWIPSLKVCNVVSYRSLAIGFSIYTLGLLAGVLWSYRTTAGLIGLRTKELSAVVAWIMFAVLLQSYVSGHSRSSRNVLVAALAFTAILVALLGIRHV